MNTLRVYKLSLEHVKQIPILLKDGLRPFEIACKLTELSGQKVSSKHIVKAIKNEYWKDKEPGKQERCPDCGGLVEDDSKPCLVCITQRTPKIKKQSMFS